MGKYLTGSSETGTKIIKNKSLFRFNIIEEDATDNDGVIFYRLKWNFDGQLGHAGISVKDSKISSSSLIDTDTGVSHPFSRPLGLYNDRSLEQVFRIMLNSIGINVTGVYAD